LKIKKTETLLFPEWIEYEKGKRRRGSMRKERE
jgi:hypothetical protein